MLSNLGMSPEQLGAMPAERVAREALERLGRGPAFIPGVSNQVFVRALRLLPRRIALRLAGAGMRSAIERARSRTRADSPPNPTMR
jgi:short-subunit dehydrogenase